ncbi:hypothetical protein HK104_009403 [Borealophlyctis nickersoniae]|nr:hypothetical protein HK104_009403 [Borealophlyctis nickersoniae]
MATGRLSRPSRTRRTTQHAFNLMVAGHTRTGKTSFIRTLVETLAVKKFHYAEGMEPPADASGQPSSFPLPWVEISAPTPLPARIEFEEVNDRVLLRLIDTPGIPIPVNVHKVSDDEAHIALANSHAASLVGYIEAQFEATLLEESKVRRNPKSPDYQTHACLYFLDPQVCIATRGLTAVDRHLLSQLTTRVNVIVCLAKSDLLTVRQMQSLRRWIKEDIAKSQIPVYAFPDETEGEDGDEESVVDPDAAELNAHLRALLPFTIVNAEDSAEDGLDEIPQANGDGAPRVLGRAYTWGTVEVENPEHCDVLQLKQALFSTHLGELKLLTRELYYEQWRTEKLLEVRSSVLGAKKAESGSVRSGGSRRVEE